MTVHSMPEAFGYYVNFDRPEGFFADVRDTLGRTVFELRDPSAIEAARMQHKRDVVELRKYLVQEGVMSPRQVLLLMAA